MRVHIRVHTVMLTLSALAAAGCEKNNGAYCDANKPCSNGAACDVASRQCLPMSADLSMALPDLAAADLAGVDLTQACTACPPEKPLCISGACAPCNGATSPDDSCKSLDQTKAHCLTTGPDAGRCVNCVADGDCTQPHNLVCDPTAHACRGCTANSECASLVCDTVFDPVFGASVQRGDCLPTSANDIIYVDKINCPGSGNAGTKAAPWCRINDALGHVTPTVDVIHAAPGSYDEDVNLGNGVKVILVGDAGGSPDTALVGNSNEPLHVNGTGASATVIGFDFSGTPGGHSAIWCDKGAIAIYQSRISNSGDVGIDSNTANCTSMVVDQCRIGPGNPQGGLRVGVSGSNTTFVITNNFIFRNGVTSNGSFGGVALFSASNVSPRVFAGNTVADNLSPNAYAGVICPLGQPFGLYDNILYDNVTTNLGVSEHDCTTHYTATDDHTDAAFGDHNTDLTSAPGFVNQGGNDYHLTATSVCKGKGSTPQITMHDYDGDPRPEAGTTRYDVGADELP